MTSNPYWLGFVACWVFISIDCRSKKDAVGFRLAVMIGIIATLGAFIWPVILGGWLADMYLSRKTDSEP